MNSIVFGRQICGDLTAAASREWLVCDGLGGYSMGTVAGMRTRRYHGLLVVSGEYTGQRHVGLAALDATLVIGDRRVRLSTDEWDGGVVDPAGHQHLSQFDLTDGIPRWRWDVGGVVVEREIAMAHGRSLVVVRHRILASDGREVRLDITPLCTWRDAHSDRFAWGEPDVENTADGFTFEHTYRVGGPGWVADGSWYRGAYLREEAARGLGATEDLWGAGSFSASLSVGETLDVVAASEPFDDELASADEIIVRSRERSARVIATAKASNRTDSLLAFAADQFVVTTSSGPSVVAGYPWFGEWSRDTMTSYEGLFLDTNRWDEGRGLLLRSAATLSEGMLANTADAGGLEYNTADATLWFVHALGRHVERTGDAELASLLAEAVDGVIEHHVQGTRFGIAVDPNDGLLSQGAPGWALTWMDARVDGRPITPRPGKAVEVNALWINALGTAASLRAGVGLSEKWSALAAAARTSFAAAFTRPDGLGLSDLAGVDDCSIRPNQLLALSLPYGPGGPSSVVDVCRSQLLTSVGLRSLAVTDPAYIGRHRGDVYARDAAYHQGTVWPWLLGPFVDAAAKVGVDTTSVLNGVDTHLCEWGVGSVSETLDGDVPHNATGCPFQAWSVAEVLRARKITEAQ